MSAILAILLMLSGAIAFVPHAYAQVPADAVQANPLSISLNYPAYGPGYTFTAYVDVINVVDLFAFQAGFYFNATALQVVSVADGGFLTNGGVDPTLAFPGSIDNVAGVVNAYGWTLLDVSKAKTGSGHLLTVVMKINPTLSPPYTDGFPGGPIVMMHFTETPHDPAQTKLLWTDGATDISPIPSHLYDGSFTLSVTPHDPIALFTVSPPPPNYVGDLLSFDGSGSTPGWNGYANVPIVNYQWNFGDGNITNTAGPMVTHSYGAAGGYTITLVVTDADGRVSTPYPKDIAILVRPSGCVLDVFTQKWRYIDPFHFNVTQGKGPNLPADMFRPGDYVELFVTTVYNGDPVANQLVAFEVFGLGPGNHFTGQAVTNEFGLGEFDFRIQWPTTGVEDEFGAWTVVVTWEVGNNTAPYKSITQTDTLTFNVGWGLWSSDFKTDLASYHKGDTVTVTYKLHNDYGVDINALNTVTLYDDLGVPIAFNFQQWTNLHPGITSVTITLVIPEWAFVGTGTAKGDEFSTWPSLSGIATGPEQLWVFGIAHTIQPADP